jgi:hypothetical protein
MLRNNRTQDVEMAMSPTPQVSSPTRLDGFPSFAEFIAKDSDAAIYRKYEHLSARNLLYLQSELHELEGQLQGLDLQDFQNKDRNDEETQKVARLWS